MADPTNPLEINIPRLKKQAKAMRKTSDLRLYEAQDALAKKHGYRNWPSLVQAHDQAKEASHV